MTLLLASLALAGEWSAQDPEPRYESDFTAHTIGRNRLRVGLLNLDYGVLDNLQVGTAPLPTVLGVVNVRAKVTAIRLPTLDASLQAGWTRFDAGPVLVTAYPIQANASWIASPWFSIHGGVRWENLEATGQFTLDDVGDAAAGMLGLDLGPELAETLAGAGSLYGGAHLTLVQGQLACDWRLNRRDSLIFQWKGYTWLSARLDAGYETEDEAVQVGVSGKVRKPLDDELLGVTTASWQFTWPHWRLRMGLGVSEGTLKNPLPVFEQAFEVYYLF